MRALHKAVSLGADRSIHLTDAALAGSDVVATGCPFCFVMMDDGIKERGADEDVKVMDIATLLADRSLERLQAHSQHAGYDTRAVGTEGPWTG